jgi:hypothetical protein
MCAWKAQKNTENQTENSRPDAGSNRGRVLRNRFVSSRVHQTAGKPIAGPTGNDMFLLRSAAGLALAHDFADSIFTGGIASFDEFTR